MIKTVSQSFPYASSKYNVFAVVFFKIFSIDYSHIPLRFLILLCFESSLNQISCFFEIRNKLSYLLSFLLFIFKNEPISTKKSYKFSEQICLIFRFSTISSILVGLLFIMNKEHRDELKQYKVVRNIIDKLFENTKTPRIGSLFSLLLNDREIIWNAVLVCENETIDQGRSYEDKNIIVSLCFFSRYSVYDGSGGVIFVSGGSYTMNINYSMFYSCCCSIHGGAIYFVSSNSCLRMICANSCSAYSHYHFAWLQASQMNEVEYLSVSYCSHTPSGYYPTFLYTGSQRVDKTNSSMNNAIQGSGILVNSPSSLTSSHCTFSNNRVSEYICIYIYSTSGIISISYSNIVHNNSPSKFGVVTVEGAGSRKMMYCIFYNKQNYLFCVRSGSLEASNSFISPSESFSTSNSVSTSNNNSFIDRISYQLQFFNSYHCNADIPVIEQRQTITFNEEYLRSISFLYATITIMIS